MDAGDSFDLERFVEAQERTYSRALRELRAGSKTTHWMWFIFPQLRGLGHSEMSTRFGIVSKAEAQAYLRHPVLGPRLKECTEAVLAVDSKSATQILGRPDDLKFRSSMTLFEAAVPEEGLFGRALAKYFGGERDQRTIEMLRTDGRS